MNKYLKGCLIILSIIVLMIALISGWFWWTMKNKHKKAEEDAITYSKECDTITTITEKPSFTLVHFEKDEIENLKFYLIRNHKIYEDTLIISTFPASANTLNINIPFKNFKKSDSIVVETRSKIYFTISGFHHYAYLHYSMFGYTGGHDCRLTEEYTINGKSGVGILRREIGAVKKPSVLE